jgi:hypothetical protein
VLAVAVALAGCGASQLDSKKAETTIKTLVSSKLGLPVKTVSCPSNVKLKKGLVTTCQVTLVAGETEPFTITQTDASGNVHIQPTNLLSTGVEKTISARLAAQGVKATATCPQHVVIKVGAKVICTATDAKGVKAGIVATITDSIGSYSLTVR